MALAAPARDPTTEALTLRVAELSSVLKQQRDEIEEKDALLEHNRKLVRDHEEIIRMQEAQLLERDAQLQSQNAEIRALRRQHTMDAEALRAAQQQLQGRLRPSGSMGLSQRRRPAERGGPAPSVSSPTRSPGRGSEADPSASVPPSPGSPSKRPPTPASTRQQLQQAIADKVVLVRALHQLTAEMAQARAEAKKYEAVSQRSLSTAWRLGQLGQLGLALLEVGDEAAEQPALVHGGLVEDDFDHQALLEGGGGSWEALQTSEPEAWPPLSERWATAGSPRGSSVQFRDEAIY